MTEQEKVAEIAEFRSWLDVERIESADEFEEWKIWNRIYKKFNQLFPRGRR